MLKYFLNWLFVFFISLIYVLFHQQIVDASWQFWQVPDSSCQGCQELQETLTLGILSGACQEPVCRPDHQELQDLKDHQDHQDHQYYQNYQYY